MAEQMKTYASLLLAVLCGGLISQFFTTKTTISKATNQQEALKSPLSTTTPTPTPPPPPPKTTTNNKQEALYNSRRENVKTSMKRQVLLLSYGRSGTTYTSAIISHHPDVFYVPEPLFRRPLEDPVDDSSTATGVMKGFFDCDPLHVDPESYLLTNLMMGNSTRPFAQCLEVKGTMTSQAFLGCFVDMWRACVARRATFIKTIRSRLEWAASLMDEYPELKVLFLIRDPRAMFHSQMRHSMLRVLKDRAQEGCANMAEDLQSFRRLRTVFPGRIMGLRYEDGAIQPMQNARNIYRFLGFDFNGEAQSFVKQITSSEAKKGQVGREDSGFGFEKADSSKTMNLWRQTILVSDVDIIDRHCAHLYSELGYKTTKSVEELRATNTSLLSTGSFEGMFQPVL